MAKRTPQVPGEPDPVDPVEKTEPDAPVEVKANKVKGELTAADYITMNSSDVDAKKLTKSVLCKDGWVVPDLPPQAPIKA